MQTAVYMIVTHMEGKYDMQRVRHEDAGPNTLGSSLPKHQLARTSNEMIYPKRFTEAQRLEWYSKDAAALVTRLP